MKRFTTIPITLYRIQAKLPVNLRDFDRQMALGRTSFDVKLHNGLVTPVPLNSKFETPNGMSLRPAGQNMMNILQQFRGEPMIYTMRCGLELPHHFCVYHEHTDHYSLQTTENVPLPVLNERLTDFLSTLPAQTKQQFLAMMEDEDDQDN